MSDNELWNGRPSFWNINSSVIKLIKTLVWCGIFLYCSRYIPENKISVPGLPLPDFLSGLKGDQFYLLVFLAVLILRQIWQLIVHFFEIFCTEINLTKERLSFRQGILNKFKNGIELYRIKDLSLHEPLFYRLLGLHNIYIVATDHTIRFPRLIGIPKNADLYEILNWYVEAARDKKGVREIDYFSK